MKEKPYILVVDDDPNIAKLEQLYLEKAGYEVSPIYGRSIVTYGDSEDCEDWR